MSATRAAAEDLLRRLAAAAPAAWRHDPLFRAASIGAAVTLALFLLRLGGPHAPALQSRSPGYAPPVAARQDLPTSRAAASAATVQPSLPPVPKIAPGHPLSAVTVIPSPSGDHFGTFTPARTP